MCTKHPSEHLLSKGDHQIIGLFFKPSYHDLKIITDNFTCVSYKIMKFKDETLATAQKIIDKTLESSQKLLKKLENLEKKFNKLIKRSYALSEIEIQDFECFKSIVENKEYYEFYDLEKFYKSLTMLFDIDLFSQSSNFIFSPFSSNYNLLSLNLETFTANPLTLKSSNDSDLSLEKQLALHLCPIENQNFCLINQANIYLIDLKKKSSQILTSINISKDYSGLIYQDRIIYIFGANSNYHSYTINFNTMNLSFITSPPKQNIYEQFSGTSSIIYSKIVLAGEKFDGLYVYNNIGDSYTKVLNLNEEYYNYAFENWVVSSDGNFYECSDRNLSQFKKYRHDFKVEGLAVYSCCVYKDYVYFMDPFYTLLRISVKLKKIESISFTYNEEIFASINAHHLYSGLLKKN